MPIRPENKARYPKDWPEISRRIRFQRAAGRCECHGECGRGTHTGRCPNTHDGAAYGTGSKVVLTVAHLDHTPENCDETNLKAMCQGCHLHYDREHHKQTAAATRRAAQAAAGQLALDPESAALPRPTEGDSVLSPDVADAARYSLDARLLNEAHDLDRPALDQWLDTQPDNRYTDALKVHAHVIATRGTLTETASR